MPLLLSVSFWAASIISWYVLGGPWMPACWNSSLFQNTMNRSWFIGSTLSLPSGPVATLIVAALKSAMSRSGLVRLLSAISGRRSSIQRPLSIRRFCTCMATLRTSKEGCPVLISIATFGRCCCSGICSEPTLIPVRSSNSFWCACSTSARGDLAKLTSSFVPLACFQSKALWALARSTMAGAASAVAEAASNVRRLIIRVLPIEASQGRWAGTLDRFAPGWNRLRNRFSRGRSRKIPAAPSETGRTPASVVAVNALHALVPLLRLDRHGRDRPRLEPLQPDRLGRLLAETIRPGIDPEQRLVDLGDQLARPVPGPELECPVGLDAGPVGDVGFVDAARRG